MITAAGGLSQTNFDYVDTPGARTVPSTRKQGSCSSTTDAIVSVSQFDGLGRTVKQTLTDGQGDILTTSTYDGLGRVVLQSKPFRGASGAGVQTAYDGLGRVISVTETADGAVTRMGYSNEKTYVRDAAGKWKATVSCTGHRQQTRGSPGRR